MSHRFHASTALVHPPPAVYAWHARPGAFERLSPPWEPVRVLGRRGTIESGDTVRFRTHVGPVPVTWKIAHHRLAPEGQPVGTYGFVDLQKRGPFAAWRHEHRFVPQGTGTRLEDEIVYRLPMDAVASPVVRPEVQRRLLRLFPYRHARTRIDLDLHARTPDLPRLDVRMEGADPLLDELAPFLSTGGHRVFRDDGIPWYDAAPTPDPSDDVAVVAVHQAADAHVAVVQGLDGRRVALRMPCVLGADRRRPGSTGAQWRRRMQEHVERAGAFVHVDDVAAVILHLLATRLPVDEVDLWLDVEADGAATPSADLAALDLPLVHSSASAALAFTTGSDPTVYAGPADQQLATMRT